ncbi:hypothetical protein OHA40_33045 [Nocardia sp. NBC_00508]|nr:hypothetical protein [Nocardia sp. NBC_00508]WUD66321.1 hypothetical protein OHA40_33045 [Nocardia sp. NBC_00508]
MPTGPRPNRPPLGPVTMVERIAHAREQAQRETFDRLAHEFTPTRCAELDALLVTDASLGISRLRWLSTGPARRSAGDRHRPALAQAKPRLPRDHGVPDTGRCGCATLFSDQLSSPMARKRLTEAVAVP